MTLMAICHTKRTAAVCPICGASTRWRGNTRTCARGHDVDIIIGGNTNVATIGAKFRAAHKGVIVRTRMGSSCCGVKRVI